MEFAKGINRINERKTITMANGKEENVEMIHDELIGNTCIVENAPFNLISLGQMLNNGWKEFTDKNYNKKLIKNGIELIFNRKDNLWIMGKKRETHVSCLLLTEKQEDIIQQYIDLHERLGHRNDAYIRQSIESKTIDTELEIEDFDWAGKNTEECIPCIRAKHKEKSKSSSSRTKSKVSGEVLHIDIMEFHKALFLIMVDEYTGFTLARKLNTKDKQSIMTTLDILLNEIYAYPNASKTKTLYCDRESAVLSLIASGFPNLEKN